MSSVDIENHGDSLRVESFFFSFGGGVGRFDDQLGFETDKKIQLFYIFRKIRKMKKETRFKKLYL